MRLDKAEDRSIQEYLETSSKYKILVQFETRSRERIATSPNTVASSSCMKTKDQLYQKVRLTPRVPRVVLKPNSQIGLQDQREQHARTSLDQPSGSQSSGTTPWITEFLVYLFLQLNSKIQIAKTRSKS